MKLLILIISLASVHGAVTSLELKECLTDNECSALECCHKEHEHLVVSKRQDLLVFRPTEDLTNKTGVCEPYKLEGERCDVFGKRNGYCECNENQGFSCQPVESDPIYPVQLLRHECQLAKAGSKKDGPL